jgi:hypothetical protein
MQWLKKLRLKNADAAEAKKISSAVPENPGQAA